MQLMVKLYDYVQYLAPGERSGVAVGYTAVGYVHRSRSDYTNVSQVLGSVH